MARVISPEQAIAQGISPASLRQVTAWNTEVAEAEQRKKLRDGRDSVRLERCQDQAAALLRVADAVEQNDRRAA